MKNVISSGNLLQLDEIINHSHLKSITALNKQISNIIHNALNSSPHFLRIWLMLNRKSILNLCYQSIRCVANVDKVVDKFHCFFGHYLI